MPSNYKILGRYIRPVKTKNTDLSAKALLGINIDKFFMPSVANVVGTDLRNYKIVKKNQFACNRMHVGRDYRIPVALSRLDEPFMVSPAYDVFEIIDQEVLLPEYLMMWFSRREFDRNAWFHTDADVRGGLPWTAFSNLKLPIPSIETQREIVREYNVIKNRIALNNQLIKKLEETAQAIYKHWFIDFEFPDEEGKPYKSNGGEMVWCEELEKEIPSSWKNGRLSEIILDTLGGDWGKDIKVDKYTAAVKCIRGTDIRTVANCRKGVLPDRFILEKNLKGRILAPGSIVIEISGGSPSQSTGRTVLITEELIDYIGCNLICSNFCRAITPKLGYSIFLNSTLMNLYDSGVFFTYENSTNGVKNLNLLALLREEKIIIPDLPIISKFNHIIRFIQSNISNVGKEIDGLESFSNLILSKMTKLELVKHEL